jgi:serine/threonine-protein kinase HipA
LTDGKRAASRASVERYDRICTAAGLRRVHQEDVCQALAIPPTRRYQNEGGPGIHDIVELLRTYSSNTSEDVRTFLDSVAYNWLIVGTDAHAKNYALLIGAGGRIRLAPLYDVASVLPYPDIDIHCVKLSIETRRGIPSAKYRNAPMAETGGGAAHGP